MLPATASLLIATYRGKDRGLAMGIWGGMAALGAGIGPVVGGYLTSNFSWRWGFRINVFVAAVLIAAAYLIKDERKLSKPQLDWVGSLLSATGLFLGVFALIEGSVYGWWTSIKDLSLFGVGLSPGGMSVVPFAVVLSISGIPGPVRPVGTAGHPAGTAPAGVFQALFERAVPRRGRIDRNHVAGPGGHHLQPSRVPSGGPRPGRPGDRFCPAPPVDRPPPDGAVRRVHEPARAAQAHHSDGSGAVGDRPGAHVQNAGPRHNCGELCCPSGDLRPWARPKHVPVGQPDALGRHPGRIRARIGREQHGSAGWDVTGDGDSRHDSGCVDCLRVARGHHEQRPGWIPASGGWWRKLHRTR